MKYLARLLTDILGRSPQYITGWSYVSPNFIIYTPQWLDTGADCRWLRIGIHLNLHPYQQRLDRISFVYSDLEGHMVGDGGGGGMFSSNCHQN